MRGPTGALYPGKLLELFTRVHFNYKQLPLQFVNRRHGRVALEHIQSLEIGQKDAHRSLFSVWQEIFQLPKPKRRRFAAVAGSEVTRNGPGDSGFLPMLDICGGSIDSQGVDQHGMSNTTSRFHTILRSAMSSGEYEKVSQGKLNLMQMASAVTCFYVI